jgi:hypothetical protein
MKTMWIPDESIRASGQLVFRPLAGEGGEVAKTPGLKRQVTETFATLMKLMGSARRTWCGFKRALAAIAKGHSSKKRELTDSHHPKLWRVVP